MKNMYIMTKINKSSDNYNYHQQGVALIMVLGLLSVMIIMAVSFAIAMRTERLAAGNYLDSVRAKQLVRGALHLAMADIHQKLHIVERESCVTGRNKIPQGWAVQNPPLVVLL